MTPGERLPADRARDHGEEGTKTRCPKEGNQPGKRPLGRAQRGGHAYLSKPGEECPTVGERQPLPPLGSSRAPPAAPGLQTGVLIHKVPEWRPVASHTSRLPGPHSPTCIARTRNFGIYYPWLFSLLQLEN